MKLSFFDLFFHFFPQFVRGLFWIFLNCWVLWFGIMQFGNPDFPHPKIRVFVVFTIILSSFGVVGYSIEFWGLLSGVFGVWCPFGIEFSM